MSSRFANSTFTQKAQGTVLPAPRVLQRKCACGQHTASDACDSCKRESAAGQTVQRAPTHAGLVDDVPPIVHEVLRSPGHPLDAATRAFMEPRFAQDFSHVRVHTDSRAAESAAAINASAYSVGDNVVFGANQYATASSAGQRLLAHELTHVVQQRSASFMIPETIAAPSDPREKQAERTAVDVAGGGVLRDVSPTPSGPAVLRDLVQEPQPQTPQQPKLTPAQIKRALNYNRASYNEESTRVIQDIVGGPKTGRFEETTVELVAQIQWEHNLLPMDGKVGPDTYDFIINELQAASATPGDCLTMFQVIGPDPLAFTRINANVGSISSRFEIRARFDPRCKCEDFEYRQFIGGEVELFETPPAGGTPTAMGCETFISNDAGLLTWNMANCFQIPGGGLPPHMREDGDISVPAGTAGHRLGHRSATGNPARDRYLPNRATGCMYESFDVVGLNNVPATANDAGDQVDFEILFRGIIQHRNGTVVDEKWWKVRGTVAIP